MFKSLITYTTLASTLIFVSVSGSCGQAICSPSADVEIGWRRDGLNWKTPHLHSKSVSGHVNDRILFKEIDSYTITGQATWTSSHSYVRLLADYGLTDKGRAHEHFQINSPSLYQSIGIHTSHPVKRGSEVYDFDAAGGYPFAFFCYRLSIIPLIGFSFHRQHLRVKEDKHSSSSSSHVDSSGSSYLSDPSSSSSRADSSGSSYLSDPSSSSFSVSSSNPFRNSPSSNPFSRPSSSDQNIASRLGLNNSHRTSQYRFTWYGFYFGVDTAFTIDDCWTLFWDTEFHFFDNCHRKRKSWTGVYFVDRYHEKSFAYGFNNILGVTYSIANSWYGVLSVDFNWWKTDSKRDELYWKKVGVNIGLGSAF